MLKHRESVQIVVFAFFFAAEVNRSPALYWPGSSCAQSWRRKINDAVGGLTLNVESPNIARGEGPHTFADADARSIKRLHAKDRITAEGVGEVRLRVRKGLDMMPEQLLVGGTGAMLTFCVGLGAG